MKKKTQKTIKFFHRINFTPKDLKISKANKTDVYYIENFWSLDNLDLKDYGSENTGSYRYVLFVTVILSKFGWTVPLKIKNAQTRKDFSEIFLINSERSPNLIETDDGKKTVNKIFTDLLKKIIDKNILQIHPLELFFRSALFA